MDKPKKGKQGFATLSPERLREVSAKGARSGHRRGTSRTWTADEARAAGRKGGQTTQERKKANAVR